MLQVVRFQLLFEIAGFLIYTLAVGMSLRKEVLRSFAAGGILLAGCQPSIGSSRNTSQNDQLTSRPLINLEDYLDDLISFPPRDYGRLNEFTGAELQIVDLIKRQYGISVISPRTWSIDGEEFKNEPWNAGELTVIWEVIGDLPPSYLDQEVRPREIVLKKMPWNAEEGERGRIPDPRTMYLSLYEGFHVYRAGQPGEVFGDPRGMIRFVVGHEWSHLFTASHPEVLQDWIKATGWEQDEHGEWVNEEIQGIAGIASGSSVPDEDFANSVAFMDVNPALLSSDRIDFFRDCKYFDGWGALENLGIIPDY
jgi:hypothetical protein